MNQLPYKQNCQLERIQQDAVAVVVGGEKGGEGRGSEGGGKGVIIYRQHKKYTLFLDTENI